MIRGIHHTAFSTPDLDRALHYYVDLVGAEVISCGDFGDSPVVDAIVGLKNAKGRAAMLRLGNSNIELFEYHTPKGAPQKDNRPASDHGLTHICLEVTDVDAEYERMVAAGITFHCPPQDMGELKATYGRDPDGNIFEILQVMDPHSRNSLVGAKLKGT